MLVDARVNARVKTGVLIWVVSFSTVAEHYYQPFIKGLIMEEIWHLGITLDT